MKKLILVRHAKTEQIYDNNKSDFERRLLPRGPKDSAIISKHLEEKGHTPDLIISSKAIRAKQTSDIFADHLDYDPEDIQEEQFIYDGYTTAEMLKFLGQFEDKYETIMIIGHNPDIASLTVNLVDEDLYHFPTACATVIRFGKASWKDIEPRQGDVAAYVYPKQFK